MSGLSTFLTSLCAASVFIGAVHLICPDGNMGKPVKYVLSLDAAAEVSDEELKTASAKYVYEQALKSNKINFTEITVCTDKTEDGSIVISKVIIFSDCAEERIRAALGEAAQNIEVEIVNE